MTLKQLKNYLKIGTLLFGISIVLSNCEKNEDTIVSESLIQTKNLDYILEKINYSQLIKDNEFQKPLSILDSRFFNNETNEFSKNSTEVADGLSILTEEINKIIANEVITWTFEVEYPALESSDFENFLVKKRNGKFNYFLISYKLNFSEIENPYEKVTSYEISEEYLTLDNLNLESKDAFDWAPIDDGGGDSNCEGIVYMDISPCNNGGIHVPTYCCQHSGGEHGCYDFPSCDSTCSGTTILSTVIDFSHCDDGGYNSSGNPIDDSPDDTTSDIPSPGGSNPEEDSGNSTVTSPISLEDPRCPPNSGKVMIEKACVCPPDSKKIENADGVCVCPEGKIENSSGLCVDDNENDDCNTSKEDLKKVFPDTSDDRLQEIADAINKHGKDFGIDTKEKLQHFISQAGHESANFTDFTENLNYRVNKLGINYWKSKFNPYTAYIDSLNVAVDSTKQNPNDYASTTSTVFVDNEKFANFVYDDANRGAGYKLGNTSTGDGYKYRGRGIFQLTGKTNYSNFNTYYQNNIDIETDLIENPNLVASDKEIAVISALWYYKNNVMDKITIDSSTNVKKVTKKINGGMNGLPDRKEIFEDCEEHIDCIEEPEED